MVIVVRGLGKTPAFPIKAENSVMELKLPSTIWYITEIPPSSCAEKVPECLYAEVTIALSTSQGGNEPVSKPPFTINSTVDILYISPPKNYGSMKKSSLTCYVLVYEHAATFVTCANACIKK